MEAEFAAFDPAALLFLRNIQQVELGSEREVITAQREPALRDSMNAQMRSLRLSSSDGTDLWKIVERDEVALAFYNGETRVERLEESQAVVHAFLPTHEKTGLGIKVNGDISTDPSRTRVVLDERTAAGIERIAELIVDAIDASLGEDSSRSTPDVLAALIPFSDPRLASLQRRSFLTDLMLAIQRSAGGRFRDLKYRPSWLNAVDFEKLGTASRIRAVGREFEQVEGIHMFLRFLGAREATLEDLSAGLKASTPSTSGAAEVVSHITKLHTTKQITPTEVEAEWPIWTIDNTPLPLDEARVSTEPLDRSFVDMVSEKVGVASELRRLVANLVGTSTSDKMVPSAQATESQSTGSTLPQPQQGSNLSAAPQRLSLKRWRSAEQQVLALLELQEWKVEDVSRQNVGYDIEGIDPEGRTYSIEVKAIDHPGQPFTLTSNEEAVARQKGDAYQLAIVRQAGADFEVAFIQDPANQLELIRQCRQWVWECSSYVYNPERFLLE